MYETLFDFQPGQEGYYGGFGGAFVPEILHETLAELRRAFDDARRDPGFWNEFVEVLSTYSSRPSVAALSIYTTRVLVNP